MSRAARTVNAGRRRAPADPASVPAPMRRETLLKAFEAMTAEDRLVLALQLCDGLADEETAAALGLSVRSVRRTREGLLLGLRRALQGVPFGARPDAPPARSAA